MIVMMYVQMGRYRIGVHYIDGNVSKEKLDRFELTASLMAQSGTCPALMAHAA
jgi:hypothetical protein